MCCELFVAKPPHFLFLVWEWIIARVRCQALSFFPQSPTVFFRAIFCSLSPEVKETRNMVRLDSSQVKIHEYPLQGPYVA